MPSYDEMQKDAMSQMPMPKWLADKIQMPERDLAAELAELRQEIAELRAVLAPVPSLIATGRDVLDEFKRLTRAHGEAK